jgi:energy-coupling factor transport system ATP-binding protein
MSEPIIIVKNLSYAYGDGPLRRVALDDISLEVVRGSCAAIVGVTGSGKSTLVQHFNGLLRPAAGTVVVDGIAAHDRRADLRELRRRVGMLFQFPETQLFERTVFADVAFGLRQLGLALHEVRARAAAALELVGLPPGDFAGRSPFELSGGQMRRVALAGVLAMDPAVLVLDEPTTGLDARARAEFYAYLRRAQRERGITIILVSHDMAEVAALADQVWVLDGGRLVLHGPPRRVFAHVERLRACGLAAPPLSEMLALLRAEGLEIPAETLTVDEALAVLRRR